MYLYRKLRLKKSSNISITNKSFLLRWKDRNMFIDTTIRVFLLNDQAHLIDLILFFIWDASIAFISLNKDCPPTTFWHHYCIFKIIIENRWFRIFILWLKLNPILFNSFIKILCSWFGWTIRFLSIRPGWSVGINYENRIFNNSLGRKYLTNM